MSNKQDRSTKRYSVEVPIGVLLSFTPPETPPNDRSESASLCSKDSTDATQPEVLTANLVDLGVTLRQEEEEKTRPTEIGTGLVSNSDTESESVISSDSDAVDPATLWTEPCVLQNSHTESPPPVPPPRSKRQHKANLEQQPNLAAPQPQLITPHPQFGPRPSPFDDFGSSIASALLDHSRRKSDPHTANTLSVTGMDLFKAMDHHSSLYQPAPHQLRASSGSPTTNFGTMHTDGRPLSAPPPTAAEFNDPWKPLPTNNSQQPGQLALSQRAKRLPPPMKPQPYGGSGAKAFIQTDKQPTATSSSSSLDPFSELDLFGSQGMKGYANSDLSSSTTTS